MNILIENHIAKNDTNIYTNMFCYMLYTCYRYEDFAKNESLIIKYYVLFLLLIVRFRILNIKTMIPFFEYQKTVSYHLCISLHFAFLTQ